jgi:hypothetical protein
MQSPTSNTPVSKCLDLAAYAARMLGKFPQNAVLAGLAAKMEGSAAELSATQAAYQLAVRDILPARVDVKYENHVSDRRIRMTQQKAEMADGKRGGSIASSVFPEGSAPITRLVGKSQVDAMKNLEGRLDAAKALWPDAAAEKADIGDARDKYEKALQGRAAAGQKSRDLRAARNAAKEKFVTTYIEVMSRVEAEFPRDKVMQDLLFDEVRTRSALSAADEDGGEGDETSENG